MANISHLAAWLYRYFWRGWRGWVTVIVILMMGWHWLMSPHVNPHPQKKVVVHGVFPYDRGWKLGIKTSFYTKNPQCKSSATVFFIFKQADVAREAWVDVPVHRIKGNQYTFTYYEDYFEPGFCEWEQGFISYHKFMGGKWESDNHAILGLREYNVINYECYYIDTELYPQNNLVRRATVCFDNLGKNNRLDTTIKDNQINFVWKNKIMYTHIISPGHTETIWKEGK